MARKTDQHRRIVEATLGLAAERGWRSLTMAEIATAAGVPLAGLYAAFPSKGAILAGLARSVDEAMLEAAGETAGEAAGGGEAEETARDRLFDVVMRRFDALAPHREGLRRIIRDLPGDPATALSVAPRLSRSMAWTLEAAGIPAGGWRGLLRVQGLAAVYAATFRTWLADDSPDLSRTMADLDGRLRRAERLLAGLPRRRRHEPGPAA
ncbi:MAG TPA: TetR family transcriptional regulator [Arenibaculum sp.]|nr:TetR family transcriptional regulator [Arenibaculum sp.]